MKQHFWKWTLAAGAVALAGCGGGSSGPSTGPTPTPTAQPPVAQNVILFHDAFTSNPNGEIYTVMPDGKGRINLTNNPAQDTTPIFSPDGRTIAFSSNRSGGVYKLFLMGSDGSNVRQLTTGAGNDRFPSFSSDGSKIVFASDRDAPTPAQLAALPKPSAKVLEARRRLAGRMRSQGRGAQLIQTPSGKPEDIYLLTIGTGAVQRLTSDATGDTSPVFSPDGSRILWVSDQGAGRDENLWLMNANGSEKRLLLDSPDLEVTPDWSPNGTLISFAVVNTRPDAPSGLFVIQPDGAGFRVVAEGNAAGSAFSPDNQKIAFSSGSIGWFYADGRTGISLLDENNEGISGLPTDWR